MGEDDDICGFCATGECVSSAQGDNILFGAAGPRHAVDRRLKSTSRSRILHHAVMCSSFVTSDRRFLTRSSVHSPLLWGVWEASLSPGQH